MYFVVHTLSSLLQRLSPIFFNFPISQSNCGMLEIAQQKPALVILLMGQNSASAWLREETQDNIFF